MMTDMCFSAQADIVAGAAVGVVGIDALRHVGRPQHLVLAALPALLALHQFDEAFVWWGLDGQVPSFLTQAAILAYLAIAFLLPVLVPLAVLSIEPDPRRRRLIKLLAVIGGLTSMLLLSAVVRGQVGAQIDGHHIAYSADVGQATILVVLYVAVTCGTLLAGSSRGLAIFGLSNLVAVALLAWLMISGLTSLWCAWAAITSIAIAVYLRHANPRATLATLQPAVR